jgi:hypothetical protein
LVQEVTQAVQAQAFAAKRLQPFAADIATTASLAAVGTIFNWLLAVGWQLAPKLRLEQL